MSIVLVGGMKRQETHYLREARKYGIELQVFNQACRRLSGQIAQADVMVIFTGKISHEARDQALGAARKQRVPVIQQHACGLASLRQCFDGLRQQAAHQTGPPPKP